MAGTIEITNLLQVVLVEVIAGATMQSLTVALPQLTTRTIASRVKMLEDCGVIKSEFRNRSNTYSTRYKVYSRTDQPYTVVNIYRNGKRHRRPKQMSAMDAYLSGGA